MTSLFHYWAAFMAILVCILLAMLWGIAFNMRPEAFIKFVLAPGVTVAVGIFVFGAIQHVRGKIDVF